MPFVRQEIETDRLPLAVRHKWGDALLAEGFVPMPKRLIRTLAGVFGERELELVQVVLAVADYDRPNLRQQPSLAFLAYLAGLDEETFTNRLGELVRLGLAEVNGDNDSMHVVLGKLIDKANLLAQKADEGEGESEN